MTALDRYDRLEALGLWREGPGARPREVIVSFGRSTLTLTDLAETPLGHWALAGMRVVGEDAGATVYSMTESGEETLAIGDRDMVAAIAAVARPEWPPLPTVPSRPAPVATLVVVVALLAAVGWVGPGLVREQAARMMPPERAEDFGDRMLIAIIAARGGACADPEGQRALDRIAGRLAPEAAPEVRVLDLGAVPAAALPGGTVLLARNAVLSRAAPEALAGWMAVAMQRDAVEGALRGAGPAALLRYALTGTLDDTALARTAEAALAPPAPEEIPPAMARLAAAGIDARPFAASLGIRGLPAPKMVEPLLSGGDRAALRNLCG